MKTARAITNRYQDMEVLNLARIVHHEEGRGPFLVTQDGSDPADPSMRECTFVLTGRGTWLHFHLYLALAEIVRQRCIHFETIQEAMHRIESLPAAVVVESVDSLRDMIETAGLDLEAADPTGGALVREIRKRHEGQTKEESV